MADYAHYSAEDFARDELFVRWVLLPDAETEAFWQQWLTTFTFRRDTVETARHLVLTLQQLPQARLSAPEKLLLRQRIFDQLDAADAPAPTVRRLGPAAWSWVAAAAALVLLVLGGWYAWRTGRAGRGTPYQALIARADGGLREVVNATTSTRPVALPDGSTVLLRPHSRLAFPAAFIGRTRTVYLEGTAFFEVTRQPTRPFFVRTTHLVTKVLGTSFEVRAQPAARQLAVTVQTGRVAVYLPGRGEAMPQDTTHDLTGFVLRPDERATYRVADHQLRRDTPPPAADKPPAVEYAETPLRTVFAQLERAYGVPIVYADQVGSCPLTASFTREPLFERLRLICKATQAEYVIQAGQIVIKGQGCN